jgi:hypothetical protein
MEISPIAGIRALPVVKTPPVAPELPAVFDIDNSARTGDETYSPSNGKSAGSSEDQPPEDEFDSTEEDSQPEPEPEPEIPSAQNNQSRQINFFA